VGLSIAGQLLAPEIDTLKCLTNLQLFYS
jgi:hypothetical protein